MRFCILLFLFAAVNALARDGDNVSCRPSSPIGAVCEAKLADLRPTQFGVGLLQVMHEKNRLAKESAAKLQKTILRKRIAVVIGPDGQLWLVDRHHLSRALWELEVRKVPVAVVGRVEQAERFWPTMIESHWAWLYDERGQPRAPEALPRHIKDLPDYEYRSLAGFAEDEHLFSKSGQVFFIEFAWAKYFGEQLGWAKVSEKTLDKRLDEARRVACLPQAASLPGYPGAICRK